MNSRKIRQVGHVECMRQIRNWYRITVGSNVFVDLYVDGRIILKLFLKKTV
jgi:hypothetical protein